MEWTLSYILSQLFTILMYAMLASTYYLKDRKKILIVNFLGTISIGIAYVFLEAWTGFAMCIVALIRNVIFMIDEKKNGKKETISVKDIFLLMFFFLIIGISTIFTYDGFLSLLSIFATMLYTYSVWQKKVIVYKLCGIPVGMLWIAYNIYIMSLFGIILESILLIASTSGYVLALKDSKKDSKNEE